MNIKPIGERVLLKPIKRRKTKSGILLSSKSSNTDTKMKQRLLLWEKEKN